MKQLCRTTKTSLSLALALGLFGLRGGDQVISQVPPPPPGVIFSQPVPNTGSYLTCVIGNFQEVPSLLHKWKVHLRSGAIETVNLTVVASAVNSAEGGTLLATVTDETGIKTLAIPYPATGETTGFISLKLQGCKIYDLSLQLIPPQNPPGPVAHHYKLGSPDPRLELGWADPLMYLEHEHQDWAINAAAGESIQIDVFTDPTPSGAGQATSITVSLTGPGGVPVFGPATFTPNGTIVVPNAAAGGYVVHIFNANDHFQMGKTSGSDLGFYALNCNNPPVARCKDVTVFTPPNPCFVNASINDGSFDPDGDPITVKQSPPGPYGLGTTTVTLTVTDNKGLSSSCTAKVTVIDTKPPEIFCPPFPVVRPTEPGQCSAKVSFFIGAFDNCGPVPVVCSPPSGSVFPSGVTKVTCKATDASGNTSSCSFEVIVLDKEPPRIVCPPDMVVGNDPGQCSALVNYPKAAATDNCGVASVVCTPPSGSVFPKGITTVTCVATDTAGNKSTCSFTVTVLDKEAPVADCKPTVNPAGNTIPTAGENPKSGENPDGFYELVAGDNCDGTNLFIYVKDSAEGPCGGAFAAGPYAAGTKVKLTQSPGQNSVKPMAGVIVAHINTIGEPVLVITDSSGNTVCHKCFVPPPPK